MPGEWTDAEIELLSAYIDGQLDESDRTALEARLAQEDDLRQELAAMRQTVALLRDLPTIRAPRAFTLTPEMVGQTTAPSAATELRVLPSTKQARPARRVWWVPAASAAGVVLLAGVFFVMTQQNSGAMNPAAARQGVAVAATSTVAVAVGSELNTIVQESVTQVHLGETSDMDTGSTTGASQPESESDDTPADAEAANETLFIQTTAQLQNQVISTQGAAPIAPPGGQPAPVLAATPTAMPTATIATVDVMVGPLSTQMEPTFSDPKFNQPSGGGGVAPVAPEMGMGGDGTPGAVAGMDALNTNPQAPGFTVATMSPIQGTTVAQYTPPQYQVAESEPAEAQEVVEDLLDEEASPTEIVAASSAAEDVPQDVRAKNDPIWIYWFNVLSDWVLDVLGQ